MEMKDAVKSLNEVDEVLNAFEVLVEKTYKAINIQGVDDYARDEIKSNLADLGNSIVTLTEEVHKQIGNIIKGVRPNHVYSN